MPPSPRRPTDGEVTFGRLGDAAVGRAAVTSAPD
ncbi:GNAT family N-acetyltransferase, cg3035/Rv0428c family, partial [[Mycobacterium] manitobense]